MPQATILRQIYDYANRANPYPLWNQLHQTPVSWQENGPDKAGTFVVSTHREIVEMLHDPRISSDLRNCPQMQGRLPDSKTFNTFIALDPPEHDLLRRLAMRHFGPPERPAYLEQMRPEIQRIATTLIDQVQGQKQIDLVENFAYPLPVTVICRILGVPRDDESQFRAWADELIENIGEQTEARLQRRMQAFDELNHYMAGIVERRRKQPGDDLISGMATDTEDKGRMDDSALIATAVLLLIAGHETTVNLIGNGTLALLKHPEQLRRLREDPGLIVTAVEELLRYDGPVQRTARIPSADIVIGGKTIPKGEMVMPFLGAADRDPAQFPNPDRLDITRTDNRHIAFGMGIHFCLGAPLARMEGQIAINTLLRRLPKLALASQKPEHRQSLTLRGLVSLPVGF
jgi:cytochrome P450